MTMHWNIDELFTYLHSWSATRRCMDAIGDAFLVDVSEQVAKVWGNPEQKRKIAMDFCVIAGKFI